jgi:adhesin transport system membrane fusion protein
LERTPPQPARRLSGGRGPAPLEDLDWAGEADWARLQQEPLRARILLWVGLLVILLLVVWAAFAEVDEVTRGEARVIPSSQLQIVQSVDGGVIEEILVREGQLVEAGELLLRVDPTRFVSSLLESRAEYLGLRAKAARLTALTEATELSMPEEVLEEAPDSAEHELRLFQSTLQGMETQINIAREQLVQRQQELVEAQSRRDQAARGLSLIQQELSVTRPLVQSGAVSEVDILRLERDLARLRGERDQAAAQIARLRAAITEANNKILDVELTVRNQMRSELSDTLSRLRTLTEGGRGLADRVRHAEVRSPVRGTVVRLLVNTPGAVVQPGKDLVEIVPIDDALLLEARIAPNDIGFLRPGQQAMVKFTAYDFTIYGGLEAVVDHISADTVLDRNNQAHYVVWVRTLESRLGEDLPIIPGMIGQVDILTGKKTILSYLLKPVLRAKEQALTER